MGIPSGPSKTQELRIPDRFGAFLDAETIAGRFEHGQPGLGGGR